MGGRSAIETRSSTEPLQHIKQVYRSDLLKGIIFSGASGLRVHMNNGKIPICHQSKRLIYQVLRKPEISA